MSRIGIYAGTFDPIHSGHVAFALQSIKAANLGKVYFLPERRPRDKQQVEHFGHRVAMIKRAIKPHPQFDILEMVDVNFSIARTLPQLRERFARHELVFLFGSDIIPGLADWPNADNLLKNGEIVIGLRSRNQPDEIKAIVESWPAQPKTVTMFESFAPDISSGKVREALRQRKAEPGILKSVERYSDHNWLYISLT